MKDKILEKAADLFLTYGFKSVTMDDIANELGISKKTIYTHFSNKNKLVEATTLNLFDLISGGIDLICALEKNPIEELFEIKSFVMKHLKDDKSSAQYQLQKYYPKFYASLKKKQFAVMQDCVINNLKRGIEKGLFRKEIDIDFIRRIYFIGMMGIKDPETFPQEDFKMTYLMESYLEYHVRAIATKKGLDTLERLIQSTIK